MTLALVATRTLGGYREWKKRFCANTVLYYCAACKGLRMVSKTKRGLYLSVSYNPAIPN